MPFPRASRALERFTVLDLTRVRAGPTCVRQLADWGANVIKIELPPDPGGGDQLGGPREGSDFRNLHRNKRSMTLNLKEPAALAAFKRMVKKADVVVENFRPGVKRRLGIDYPQLRKVNPKLVYASISGFGQNGPYADRPGFDQIAQGMGGLMPSPISAPACSARSASWWRCSSARSRSRANTCRPRCCRRRYSCLISRGRAG
jgi:crotonobetainyl-CoA:carnitine CoA-transferase CaiB-like acyl-CoA transferase